jgi:catechol-2,3-dioxygenase
VPTPGPSSTIRRAPRTAELAGVAHLVLRVEDWKRAARWYEEVLGFERRKGDGYICFARPGADVVLLFRPVGAPVDPSSAPSQRLDHLALFVPTIESLEAWRRHLAGVGIATEIERQAVGASITLHDPDGLEVELFCPAEGSPLAVGSSGAAS